MKLVRKIVNHFYPEHVAILEGAVNLDHVVSLANKLKDIDFCELGKRLLKNGLMLERNS